MMRTYREREDKFDVEAGFVVPDVTALLPPGGRVQNSTDHLCSEYFDTAGHDLLRAGMTLRRRTGTTDNGWQLKVPLEPVREEIRLPEDGHTVPEELQRLLVGVTRGHPLIPVASITTERAAHRLLDPDGDVLVEIDDDTVRASVTGEGTIASRWREVEVELGRGDEQLLQTVGKLVRHAGAYPATSRSKLARALAASASPADDPALLSPVGPVAVYVAEQQRVLLSGDLALRRGQESVIHKTRVAVRRLRSTLRTFQALFCKDQAAALDQELRWFADLLGEVRDRHVLNERLHRLIDELDDGVVLGPVRARIDTELGREQAEHWARLQAAMTGQRYLALLKHVDAWVREPPLTAKASKSVPLLRKLVARADRKVTRRLSKANASDNVELLHSARKAAKRARYAAELAEPAIGGMAARKQAKRYQKLQDLLGEHQDSQVSADLLRRLGAKAGSTPGENGFTFGILHEREQQLARAVRQQARRIAAKYR